MNGFQKGLFDKIQKNAKINPEDIYKIAESVKHADFTDEKTVRKLIQQLSKLANRPVPKDKEDKIVESIIKNKMPMDSKSLNQFFDK